MTSYTVPTTIVTGDLITASRINTDWIDNIKHLYEGLNTVVILQHVTSGNGGTATSGSWETRTLNTELLDTDNICTLASNQFTLPAGTYEINGYAVAAQVLGHQSRLQNVTDGTTVLWGSGMSSGSSSQTSNLSVIMGRFTITDTKTFELQTRVNTTAATSGWGISPNIFGSNYVYASITLWKRA